MVAKPETVPTQAPEEGEPSTSEQEATKVMYIGHLPHGFYEKQLKGFFSQFGEVRQLRVSRNKKTGKAKHYAYLEFRTPEVAKIAAEAMDGYMLFTQKLDCRVLKKSELHKDLFKNANRTFKSIPWKQVEARRHDAERTDEQKAQRVKRAISRDQKRKQQIEKLGIEYEYKPLKAPKSATVSKDADKDSLIQEVAKASKKSKQTKISSEDVVKAIKVAKKSQEVQVLSIAVMYIVVIPNWTA